MRFSKSLQTHTPYPFKIGRLNRLLMCMYLFSNPDAAEQVNCVKLLILQLYIRFHPRSRIFKKTKMPSPQCFLVRYAFLASPSSALPILVFFTSHHLAAVALLRGKGSSPGGSWLPHKPACMCAGPAASSVFNWGEGSSVGQRFVCSRAARVWC